MLCRARRRRGRRVSDEHDDLHAAHFLAVDRFHRVAHGRELCAHQVIQRLLQAERVGHLRMAESRHIRARLAVGAEVEDVDQQLRVSLRLHVAAHQRDGHQRLIVVHHEARGQRVVRPLVGLDGIGAFGIESK